MTTIVIAPAVSATNAPRFQAVAGDQTAFGDTVGLALDGLLRQLPAESDVAVVLLPRQRPDRYFSAEQQQELSALMERWRAARDEGSDLLPDEFARLEALVNAELVAAGERAAALALNPEP